MAKLKDPRLARMRSLELKEQTGSLTDREHTELLQLDVWWATQGARDRSYPVPSAPAVEGLRWLDVHEAQAAYVSELRTCLYRYGRIHDASEAALACRQGLERLRHFHRDIRWDRIPIPVPPEDATEEELRRVIEKQPSGPASKEARRRLKLDEAFVSWLRSADRYRLGASLPDEQPVALKEGDAIAWENRLAALKASRRYFERSNLPEPAWLADDLEEAASRAKHRGYLSSEDAMTAGAMQPRGRPRAKILAMRKVEDILRAHRSTGHIEQDEYGYTHPPLELSSSGMWEDKLYLNGWLVQYRACEELCDSWRAWDPPPNVIKYDRRLGQLRQMREDIRTRLTELSTQAEPVRPVDLVEYTPTKAVDRRRAETDAATRQRMLLHVARWESPAFESDGRKYIPERFLQRGIGGRSHDRIREQLAERVELQDRIRGLEHLAGPWWGFRLDDLDFAVLADQDRA